jgi:hypothetical protein
LPAEAGSRAYRGAYRSLSSPSSVLRSSAGGPGTR